ncbi:MAG TPA: hypothetical protein VFN68_02665 [Acidimicrobiales bacterium]|nr:hypothetical protein [Acidimicrobiales bacterium]
MSDADNQMGGTGGETGREPGGPPRSGASQEAAEQAPEGGRPDGGSGTGEQDQQAVTEESKESFPASDPPANY